MTRLRQTLATCLSLLIASSALARPTPSGRTYFTVLLGFAADYDARADCLAFTDDGFCTLDGALCGAWQLDESSRKRLALSLEINGVDSGRAFTIDGQARFDARGAQSSIGGAARLQIGDAVYNFALAGRAVPKGQCPGLVESFEGGVSPGDPSGQGQVIGSGLVSTEPRSVRGFHRIVIRDSGRLELEQTGTESLEISAEDNILPLIESEVRRGVLELGIDSNGDIRTTREIVYRLTVRDLEAITVENSIAVEASGIDGQTWTVDLSGTSSLVASGRLSSQEVHLTGSANYLAEALDSDRATVDLSGSSRAVLRVSDRIDGSVSGSASLEYYGDPEVSVATMGTASVRRSGD